MKLNCLDLVPRNASIDDIKAAIERQPHDDILAAEYNFLTSGAILVEFKETPEKYAVPLSDVVPDDKNASIALKLHSSLPLCIVVLIDSDLWVVVYPKKESAPFVLSKVCTRSLRVTPVVCSEGRFPSWGETITALAYQAFCGIATGRYSLEPSERKARYKKGKFRPCRAVSEKQEKRLISSHIRSGFERVLKHPRYYKNGDVPEDPKLLKRVKVRECNVNRDINRFDAVKVV